jgi:hypothetical protein
MVLSSVYRIHAEISEVAGGLEVAAGSEVEFISPLEFREWDFIADLHKKGIIHYPRRYDLSINNDSNCSYKEIVDHYLTIHTHFTTMGLMFTDLTSGQHCAVLNPVYEEVKNIRGNNPNLQYQYLCLRRTGKVMDFLKYFPMYKKAFYNFRDEFETYVTNLHNAYFTKFVQSVKTGSDTIISKKYYYHACQIHFRIFLPSMTNFPNKTVITRKVVRAYLDSLDPDHLLHTLNYEKKQYCDSLRSLVESKEDASVIDPPSNTC